MADVTTDPIDTFLKAARDSDPARLTSALAQDVELMSPLVGALVFRGTDDVQTLLVAVYRVLSDVVWDEIIGEGATRVALGRARVAGLTISDAMVFELDEAGQIKRIRPHLRPWLATTIFAAILMMRLACNVGVISRAAMAGRRFAERTSVHR